MAGKPPEPDATTETPGPKRDRGAKPDRGVLLISGASSLIGQELAKLGAAAGYALCLSCRTRTEPLEGLAEGLRREGRTVAVACADVSAERPIEALFDTAARLGPLTAVALLAGIANRRAGIADLSASELRQVVDTNLQGTMLCVQHAARAMQAGGGAIVTLSSQVVASGGKQLAPYAAAKAGIEAFTRSVARELAPAGIRVNCVRPGVIASGANAEDDAFLQRSAEAIPLGRTGTAAEVASVIAFLLSEAASYVTGAVIPVTGGR